MLGGWVCQTATEKKNCYGTASRWAGSVSGGFGVERAALAESLGRGSCCVLLLRMVEVQERGVCSLSFRADSIELNVLCIPPLRPVSFLLCIFSHSVGLN